MTNINQLDKSYVIDPRSFSNDGRLMSLGDNDALNGKVCLNDIQTGYYNSYADMRAGQITYYKDNEVQRPFASQLFNLYNSTIDHKDSSCLSFIKDTQSFRNDLLASIMWRRHQEEYENNEIV
jgi:hypothetical protein